jgi:hypothetical protein
VVLVRAVLRKFLVTLELPTSIPLLGHIHIDNPFTRPPCSPVTVLQRDPTAWILIHRASQLLFEVCIHHSQPI